MNRNILIILIIGIILFIWLRNRNKQVSISTPDVTGYIMQFPSNADVQAAQEAYEAFLAQEANKIYTQQVLGTYISLAKTISNIVGSGGDSAFTPNQIWMMESSDY